VCREGAGRAQQLLEDHSETDVRVYAVWFPVLGGDRRSTWDPELLSDPRVTNYWDETGMVSRWLAERADQLELSGFGGGTLWDAYLVFLPDATLGGTHGVSPVTAWTEPVVADIETLEATLFGSVDAFPASTGRGRFRAGWTG
jgi:hypothetical protein